MAEEGQGFHPGSRRCFAAGAPSALAEEPEPTLADCGEWSGTQPPRSAAWGRYSLKKKIEKDLTLLENSAPRSKPYLDIQASPFGELLDVYYRNGEEAVALDPPAGSLGRSAGMPWRKVPSSGCCTRF